MLRSASNAIPGVDPNDIAGAIQNLSAIPKTDLADSDRFSINVLRIIEERARVDWPHENDSDVAAFLYVQYPRSIAAQFKASGTFDIESSSDGVLGNLYFLNQNASRGYVTPLPCRANELLDWLSDNGLGGVPLVIAYRGRKRITFRPKGADGKSDEREIREAGVELTHSELTKGIRLTYEKFLRQPQYCPLGVWKAKASSKYFPDRLPEKAIQNHLHVAITMYFQGNVRVDPEETTPVGRIDLKLMIKDPLGKLTYWAILELKVARSFSFSAKPGNPKKVTDKDNADNIAEGVRQARAFGVDKNTTAFVDIFDLRKKKATDLLKHPVVLKELDAKLPKPTCRTWPMYGSMTEMRRAEKL